MKRILSIVIDSNKNTCNTCNNLDSETHKCCLFSEWLDYIGRHHYRCSSCIDAENEPIENY